MPNIVVENGTWGSSGISDVKAVVRSVCSIFYADAAIDVADPIIVRFSEQNGPLVLEERGPNGEHTILVNANNRLWARLAYQFAHEYCHVFSEHYRVQLHNRFRWLEESLCEVASLYALERMGSVWQANPPYSHWRSYTGSLTSYAVARIDATDQFDTPAEFQEWLSLNIDRMIDNSVIRELNNVVAVRLLPYFRTHPEAWRCVTRMNTQPNLSGDLSSYFLAWSRNCDDSQYVIQIARLMGVLTDIAT
jgi:hypothetical protein